MNVEAVFLVTSNSRFVPSFQLEADTLGVVVEQVNKDEGDGSMVERSNSNPDILGSNLGHAHWVLKRHLHVYHSILHQVNDHASWKPQTQVVDQLRCFKIIQQILDFFPNILSNLFSTITMHQFLDFW